MAISVRRATVDDAAAIASVHVASWEGAYRGLVPDAWLEERTLQARTVMWRRVLDQPRVAFVFVAEDTAEISALSVDPRHWRTGAGRALMDAALGELAARGFMVVTLRVFEANPRARAFYATCGFTTDDGARQGEPPEIRVRRETIPDSAGRFDQENRCRPRGRGSRSA